MKRLTEKDKGVIRYALYCAIRDRQTFREAYDRIEGPDADDVRKSEDEMIKKFHDLQNKLKP